MAHTVASRPVPGGETWARSALSTLTRVPGVQRAGLAVTEGGGRRLLFTASDRDGENFLQWCEIDAYADVPLTDTVHSGRPFTGASADLATRFPAFADRQSPTTVAVTCQPIVSAGQVLGGYVLYFDEAQPFDRTQQVMLAELGARLGDELRGLQRATRHATRALEAEPTPEDARVATHVVAPEVRAVAGARHFAQSTLTSWAVDQDVVETAVLCLNELVTNAILHTDSGCQVRVLLDQDVLSVTVRDGGSTVVVDPSHVATDPLAVHGRGLDVVAKSSTRWGSELDAGGMTVWFVLDLAPAFARR